MKAQHIILGVAAATAGLASAGAHAQSYPARPVTVVVPFTPGGGSDNVARLISAKLSERIGKPFVIENRPGAGTNIGNELAARATPDGYTLLFGQFTLSVNPYLYKNLRYDIDKDLIPVVQIANTPTVLIVKPDSDITSVKALIDKAKSKAGKLNYASGGEGTPPHLSGELFRSMAGVDMVHVPYKGSAPAMTDLMGGQVDLMIETSTSVLPPIKGNKVRAVAVASSQRLAALPDVPTFAEQGLPGFEVLAWYGLMAPTGTPRQVVTYLNDQVNQILREPDVQQQLIRIGGVPVGGSPEDMGKFMKIQAAKWKDIIQKAHITLE